MFDVKEYPEDFYAGSLKLQIVNRAGNQPSTLAEWFEANTLKSNLLVSLGFCLMSLSEQEIENTNPTNLQVHLENVGFLIMSLANDLIITEKDYQMKFKAEVKNGK